MRAFTISSADLARCPKRILSVAHWREDGTCLCVPPTLEPVEVRETVEGTAYRFKSQADRARFITYNFPRLRPTNDKLASEPRAATYKALDGRRITVYGQDCLMVWKGAL